MTFEDDKAIFDGVMELMVVVYFILKMEGETIKAWCKQRWAARKLPRARAVKR